MVGQAEIITGLVAVRDGRLVPLSVTPLKCSSTLCETHPTAVHELRLLADRIVVTLLCLFLLCYLQFNIFLYEVDVLVFCFCAFLVSTTSPVEPLWTAAVYHSCIGAREGLSGILARKVPTTRD